MRTVNVYYVVFVYNIVAGLLYKSRNENLQFRVPNNSFSFTSNSTLYKSYANNPFGTSVKLQDLQTKDLTFKTFGSNEIAQEEGRMEGQKGRPRRNVLNLYNMISCATSCNPLIYKGYGCFCGFLGSGYAVDGIDRCCKSHDWCYQAANCPYYLEYFIPYYWTCHNNVPYCSTNHGFLGGYNSCSHRLCECDRTLSNCLRRYHCPKYRVICDTSPLRYVQNILMNF